MTFVTTTVRAIGKQKAAEESEDRSNVSALDRSRRSVRLTTRILAVVLIACLVVVSFGPLLWLFKAALSTSQDILKYPFEWWPSGIQWQNLPDAWSQIRIGQYLLNTVWMAAGCWFFGLLVALTGGYGISILKPRYAKVVNAGVLATLFIPGVVSLISLYVTILDVPLIGVNLVNTYWAVWLPTAASAFNVLLVARFFDRLPRDVFEAARIDGAGVFRVFWSIVLPMSRPVIGVVSLLTIVGSWKEFLWPLLVLPSPDLQPLSVGLYRVSDTAPTSLLMAGMFISVIIPIALFLMFQRQFLRSAGQAGAIKG
ncbi:MULTISPECIES: carbohydrate ABC transporter permease [Microbacterium]|uniref:L-arabinose transport system permease protein AraQ n=1 Tax=Microbacterium trichothecenolyticum TaxID=69370 RepID=A0A0M2HCZ1_MICTR|nr:MULTISPECIES: carbohydrate ABC transporter permease [Microbacterium]KJL44491.1 L-arabinose transport system permease protein AraQ [Microbacterium trichothecenolyticum]MDR7188849.1 multiple sugar transport system permease protein [Microbacterium sp. BE35]